jgi:hypothetical protein
MRMKFSAHTVITKAAEMRVLSRGLKKVSVIGDCVVETRGLKLRA